jgi:hypothetical protein
MEANVQWQVKLIRDLEGYWSPASPGSRGALRLGLIGRSPARSGPTELVLSRSGPYIMNMDLSKVGGVLAAVALLVGCRGGGTGNGTGVRVIEGATLTRQADGSLAETNVKGRKRIALSVILGPGNRFLPSGGVQVTHWLPGHQERTVQAQAVPGAPDRFFVDLPESDQLDVCEKMLYRWTVIYARPDPRANGLFLGAERFVMPTQTVRSSGTIEQALCGG